MPTYVYECQKCAEVFEVDQRISEDPLTKCQCCEDGTVKRLIQPTAVMFKGSGFYVNDAVKPASPVEKKAEKAAEPAAPEAAPATPTPAKETTSS
jgi:putative FmdB family regulatory protein